MTRLVGGDLPEVPLEASSLLRALARHGVDFVVVGGMAGLAHGSAYPTYDLDIAYARDRENISRLVEALKSIGVTLRGAPADLPFQLDERTLENGTNFTFDSAYGSLDILGDVAGISSYDELRDEASLATVEGVEVRIASIDHLIAMKRAANRPKDKLMVEEYIVIADEQRRASEGGE
jgi:predicted nucleotidyltransferase